jgi:cytoskeletal protein RodZ
MSSGVCKNNDDEEKKKTSQGSSGFKFWIYLAFIILGLLLLILIGFLIYLAISSRKTSENNSSPVPVVNNPVPVVNNTTSFPTFSSKDISSFKQAPEVSSISPSVPPPQPKKPFLSSLMTSTSNLSNIATEQISSSYNRTIPVKKGGFRCFNRRRF